MRVRSLSRVAFAAIMMASAPVWAQAPTEKPPEAAPGVISGGSDNVSIGKMPAARDGERTTEGGTVTGSSPNVYINGRPAAVSGDRTNCGGIVVGGGNGVFINGKPAARTGDLTTGCEPK